MGVSGQPLERLKQVRRLGLVPADIATQVDLGKTKLQLSTQKRHVA